MKEQERKVFDLEEQKLEDLLAVIPKIKPVISLIRELGDVEKELLQAKKIVEKEETDIELLSKTICIFSVGNTRTVIRNEIIKKKHSLNNIVKKRDELQNIYNNIEYQLIQYQEYAEILKYYVSASTIEKILKSNSFKEEEEILAILFILVNVKENLSIITLTVEENLEFLTQREYVLKILKEGWNYMFEQLKDNNL